MSFVVAIIISNDCNESMLNPLRNVYGISFKEVSNRNIKNQIGANQKFYMLNDESNGYFWNNWTPVGKKPLFDAEKNVSCKQSEKSYSAIVSKWEWDFNLRYISFEAQMYIMIIRYLKLICGIQKVGLIGFMMSDSCDDCQFPVFDKITVPLNDLNADVLYNMKEDVIYYFEPIA